ncbi:hypothetical protein O6H91_01G141300 [Diphasiastrum complanatum]|uniref:Uncharacterized protein n=1 Tax=Diphasiastrum complanatum TaxID=34168 RepID=A0ACC2EWU3_DIPCM|nr:hypothetical protein O6H91_01G141300 [Diphasiastrum complanatum]
MVSVAIVSFAARVGLQVCVISLHTRAAPIYPPYASSIFCILEQPSAVAAGAAAAEEDVAAVAVSRSTAVDATTAEEAINNVASVEGGNVCCCYIFHKFFG